MLILLHHEDEQHRNTEYKFLLHKKILKRNISHWCFQAMGYCRFPNWLSWHVSRGVVGSCAAEPLGSGTMECFMEVWSGRLGCVRSYGRAHLTSLDYFVLFEPFLFKPFWSVADVFTPVLCKSLALTSVSGSWWRSYWLGKLGKQWAIGYSSKKFSCSRST